MQINFNEPLTCANVEEATAIRDIAKEIFIRKMASRPTGYAYTTCEDAAKASLQMAGMFVNTAHRIGLGYYGDGE